MDLGLTAMTLLDALGWAGSALLVFSVMQTRILRLRVLNLQATVMLLAFNVGIQVWSMVAMNAGLAVINIWYIAKLLRERRGNSTAYAVLEVPASDAYLRHFLSVQGSDIARYFPHFDPGAAADHRSVYLVQHGHETAGVVVVEDAGGGVAQIQLDYVTPAFRDFSPGEYVYRQSDLFRRQGFRRVVTPPGMVAPYYERLGFRQQGGSWQLDLDVAPDLPVTS